jgi:hypothetical protein
MISRMLFVFGVAAFAVQFADAATDELHAIVLPETEYLIGARADGKWLNSQQAARRLTAGTTFRLFSFTEEVGRATGGKASSSDYCPETYVTELSLKPKQAVIGIAAPWNPMPRKPMDAATTQPVYIGAVAEFLASRGLAGAQVKITRIVRVDLDGDGEEEVLISATNYNGNTKAGTLDAASNNYSCVLLRRVVGSKVNTQLLAGEFYPKAKKSVAPYDYRILSVLDVDGDGKLEVLLQTACYEGVGVTIYTLQGAKPKKVLTTSCGA